MFDLAWTIQTGLFLSILASIYLLVVLILNPRLFLQDYPPSIQQSVPPKNEKEKRLSVIIGILFLLLLVGVPFLSTLALSSSVSGSFPFLHLFLHAFGMIFIFNLVDLLVLDWLIFCTITPQFLVIPGTEGMEAYKDYEYHFIAFIKGTGLSILGGLLVASSVYLIQF